jgi:hypothetical protein
VAVLAALRALDVPSVARTAVLGLAIGVAGLVRFEAIALLPLLGLPALRPQARRGVRLAVASAAALAVIAPWSVRNSLEIDHAMLVSSEDGPVLAGANCSRTYTGYDLGYWRAGCVPRVPNPSSAHAAATLRRAGFRYARDHAARLPVVEAVRLLRTFSLWQPKRLVYFAEGRLLPGRSVAVAATWLILVLAAVGARMLARAERRPLLILLAPVGVAVLTTLLAFGYARFRYAADVSLIVLAAIPLRNLSGSLQPRLRMRWFDGSATESKESR